MEDAIARSVYFRSSERISPGQPIDVFSTKCASLRACAVSLPILQIHGHRSPPLQSSAEKPHLSLIGLKPPSLSCVLPSRKAKSLVTARAFNNRWQQGRTRHPTSSTLSECGRFMRFGLPQQFELQRKFTACILIHSVGVVPIES